MAPEALDARVNLHDIESFKQIDAYALAFVLWEICTRCKFDEGTYICVVSLFNYSLQEAMLDHINHHCMMWLGKDQQLNK